MYKNANYIAGFNNNDRSKHFQDLLHQRLSQKDNAKVPKILPAVCVSNCLPIAERIFWNKGLLQDMDPPKITGLLGKRNCTSSYPVDLSTKQQMERRNALALGMVMEEVACQLYKKRLLLGPKPFMLTQFPGLFNNSKFFVDLVVLASQRKGCQHKFELGDKIRIEIKTLSTLIFKFLGNEEYMDQSKQAKEARITAYLKEIGVLNDKLHLIPSHRYCYQAMFYASRQSTGLRAGELVFVGPEGLLVLPFTVSDSLRDWLANVFTETTKMVTDPQNLSKTMALLSEQVQFDEISTTARLVAELCKKINNVS